MWNRTGMKRFWSKVVAFCLNYLLKLAVLLEKEKEKQVHPHSEADASKLGFCLNYLQILRKDFHG